MNRLFLQRYESELTFLRQMAGEFAERNPTTAGRLNLTKDGLCDDPHVERLLEGFAFMAARVQLKLDAEFPRFTQGVIEAVQPHYLAPTPSMAIVQFEPKLKEIPAATGSPIPRHTLLRSQPVEEVETQCVFRTAHDLRLWPLELVEAEYATRGLAALNLPPRFEAAAALRLRLRAPAEAPLSKIALDRLPVYLKELGRDDIAARLFEAIFARGAGVVVQSTTTPGQRFLELPASHLRPVGFDDDESLLPYGARGFQGYRLLREYFAFPQRFCFFELTGLANAFAACPDQELDVILPFRESDDALEDRVNVRHFALYCTPAINLFPMELDRVWVTDRFHEFHVIPDRTRTMDFEVFEIQKITGYGLRSEELQEFQPFYLATDRQKAGGAYYTTHRVPRTLTHDEQHFGPESSYTGSEVYLSLVDPLASPFRHDLHQLGIEALCTNRHLPIRMPRGLEPTDFHMDLSAPCDSIRCLSGPTVPRPSWAEGELSWRLISHLSLNHLCLADARSLRDQLLLYANKQDGDSDSEVERRIAGLRALEASPIVREVASPGPICFARGRQIKLLFDEAPFEGLGVFMLGAVLHRFLTRYVSINSFVETVLTTTRRGEIIRWPAQLGTQETL